jgi:hypothetical protein
MEKMNFLSQVANSEVQRRIKGYSNSARCVKDSFTEDSTVNLSVVRFYTPICSTILYRGTGAV